MIRCARLLAGLLLFVAAVFLPAAASAQAANREVLVLLQNEAGVPSPVLEKAQAEALRLYRLIGVAVTWITKLPEPERPFRTVLLVISEPADQRIHESALGLTYVGPTGRGLLAYVFWRRVERAALKFSTPQPLLLAAAIAHEIGHTLLNGRAHAKRGLMAEPWDSGHFRSASAGLLLFSEETAGQMAIAAYDETNPHVRSTSPAIAALLDEAKRESATFAGLLSQLDESDVIVHIQPTTRLRAGLGGATNHDIRALGQVRYLRVLINPQRGRERLIGLIAHELQHALEIAREPTVVSEADVDALFQGIGFRCPGGSYETYAARDIETRVIDEALAHRRSR